MAEEKQTRQPKFNEPHKPTKPQEPHSCAPQKTRPEITRRDFLIRSNAGAVAVGVMTGTGFAGLISPPSAPAQAPAAASTAVPMKVRRVALDLDSRKQEVSVDVRESLWETLNYQLGLSNCNLGCDRAQCGACTVLVDGKAVNGCTVLTARLGRGQEILTVAGIALGPGLAGLHPVQRAFWLEGGFQCGICTRGFVMSAYALLQTNKNPTNAEIKEALAGNICRCGEYAKILTTVQKAAAELRGEKVSYTAPWIGPEEAGPAGTEIEGGVSKQFEFVTPLGTIEQFDDLALELRQRPGFGNISGSERTITVTWDPARLDEAGVRRILAETGHPVR